jgi:F420-dependent oxidoreductase-like protein
MHFGVFVPQGWKMELASIDGGEAKWAKAVELAIAAERAGFDSIWVYDHVHNIPRPAHEAVFECWTTVAAISQLTSTVRIGQMVGCASYRNPALLAKITATVDVISGGRLDWGIGAGWYEQEYRAYGYEFPRPAERIGGLADTVEIVKRMWTEPDATYHGRYYSVDGAQCDPKPVQQPHPPIWIGGAGEQLTLRVVAEHADYSNFGGDQAMWAHKRDVLRAHCDAAGRDPAEIRMTWSPEVLIRESEADVAAAAAGTRSLWGGDTDSWRASNLVGTAEQVCERLQGYVDLGLAGVVAWCADYPDTETLERFATDVVPNFR